MKKIFTLSIALILILSGSLMAQKAIDVSKSIEIDYKLYDQLKSEGKLDPLKNYIITGHPVSKVNPSKKPKASIAKSAQSMTPTGGCDLYAPPNIGPSVPLTGWSVLAKGDDSPSQLVSLPFTFCFYGQSYTSAYININGNLTLGAPYGTFSSAGFTTPGLPAMFAPFWADVQTTCATCGDVYYRVYNDYIHVIWQDVGYYPNQTDKLNTFGLIITDGNSNVLPNGNNVAFFYEDMQWTTGGASGGVNGFGGAPATVGTNLGTGINYIQIGRFDAPGTNFFGPLANNSQVSWLDNQSFIFNTCNLNNAPPVSLNLNACDTIFLCLGDTFNSTFTFSAPEVGQTTTVTVDTTGFAGLTILNSTTGFTGGIDVQIIPTQYQVGIYNIQIIAVDNFSTPDSTILDLVVVVTDNTNFAITGDTLVCTGETTVLTAPLGYITYVWNNGAYQGNPITVPAGTYFVEAIGGACSGRDTITVGVIPPPLLGQMVFADTTICTGDSVLGAILNSQGDFYNWYASFNGQSFTPVSDTTFMVLPNIPTSVQIYATVGNDGCVLNHAITTINLIPNPDFTVSSNDTICEGESTTLTAIGAFNNYTWTPTTGLTFPAAPLTSIVNAAPTQTTFYTVKQTNAYGCSDSTIVTVAVVPYPILNAVPTDGVCGSNNGSIAANVSSGTPPYIYVYNGGIGTIDNVLTGLGPGSYPVEVVDKHGCRVYDTVIVRDYIDIDAQLSWNSQNSFYSPGPPIEGSTPFEISFTNQSTGTITNYVWYFGNGDTLTEIAPFNATTNHVTYNEDGTYSVMFIAYNNNPLCADTFVVDVQAIGTSAINTVPNVITPNGDGFNDQFELELVNIIKINASIFNRWGKEVYTWDALDRPWRGLNIDGAELPPGTYFYTIVGEGIDGKKHEKSGFVQLLR